MSLNLSMNEIERLLPGAFEDINKEVTGPHALRAPPNPVKTAQFYAQERKQFTGKLDRLNELLRGWLELKMELIGEPKRGADE